MFIFDLFVLHVLFVCFIVVVIFVFRGVLELLLRARLLLGALGRWPAEVLLVHLVVVCVYCLCFPCCILLFKTNNNLPFCMHVLCLFCWFLSGFPIFQNCTLQKDTHTLQYSEITHILKSSDDLRKDTHTTHLRKVLGAPAASPGGKASRSACTSRGACPSPSGSQSRASGTS